MTIPRRLRAVLVLLPLVFLFLSGCGDGTSPDGSPITRSNFEQIRAGMSGNDLVRLLGKPTDIQVTMPSMDAYWIWIDGEKRVDVLVEPNGLVRAQGRRVVKRAENLD